MAGLSNRACSFGFASLRNFGQALSRILAFAVVGVGASLRRLCATAIVHPCTFMNALLVSHPCETLGVHFIRHPCLTRKLRVLPPAAPKIIPRLLSGVLFLVPMAGVEPARYRYQRILSYLLHREYKRTQPLMEVANGHQKRCKQYYF